MQKFNRGLDRVEEILSIVVFSIMCLVVLWSVICRFILRIPFSIGEELARYLMIYGIFIGVSIGVRRNAHLGVEAFASMLPKATHYAVDIISQVLSLALYVAFFYFSARLTQNIYQNGQTSAAMLIPMWLAYLALPVGFGLSVVRSVQMLVRVIKKEEIEVEEVDV